MITYKRFQEIQKQLAKHVEAQKILRQKKRWNSMMHGIEQGNISKESCIGNMNFLTKMIAITGNEIRLLQETLNLQRQLWREHRELIEMKSRAFDSMEFLIDHLEWYIQNENRNILVAALTKQVQVKGYPTASEWMALLEVAVKQRDALLPDAYVIEAMQRIRAGVLQEIMNKGTEHE